MTMNIERTISAPIAMATATVVIAIGFLLTSDASFFWDAASGTARPALFYSANPTSFFSGYWDLGEPYILQRILGMLWRVFGEMLIVARLMYALAAVGTAVVVWRIVSYLFADSSFSMLLAWMLVMLDATVYTQLLLPSSDAFLIFFGSIAIDAIIRNNRRTLAISLLLLCLVSRRGMLVSSGLILADAIESTMSYGIRGIKRTAAMSSLAIIAVICYVVSRLTLQGWIIHNADGAWDSHRQIESFAEILKNCVIYVARNVDCNHWILILAIVVPMLRLRERLFADADIKRLALRFISCHVVFALFTIPFSNPFGIRYFCVMFIMFALIASIVIFRYSKQWLMAVVSIAGFVLFHFVVYPDPTDKSWDASLAHVPFYEMRDSSLHYCRHILKANADELCGGFQIEGDEAIYYPGRASYDIPYAITERTNYYILTNISNPSDDLYEIFSPQVPIYQIERRGIWIKVYRLDSATRNRLMQ